MTTNLSSRKKLTLSLIQTKMGIDPKDNLSRAILEINKAARQGAQIICMPELFRTIYFPQYPNADKDSYAESIPGISTEAFSSLAKNLKVVIIAPIYEKDHSGHYFNSAVVIDADGKVLEPYHKMHIPHDPLFYEKFYFEPGQLYKIFKTQFATFAVLICYDQWFPEAARSVTLMGADIIFYPTAIGTILDHQTKDGDWHDAWETVMRGHAIANAVHIVAINRVGVEDQLNFWGGSFVCDSFGQILKKASLEQEEIVTCSVDLSHNQHIRDGWGFFRNRRPDSYDLLTKTMGIDQYFMPAEWEKHKATWLAWPHDPITFPQRVKKVERLYVSMISHLHQTETVHLLVLNEEMQKKVEKLLASQQIDLNAIQFHIVDYADVWIRDWGATFVLHKNRAHCAQVKWKYNAYGEKFPDLLKDDFSFLLVPSELERFDAPFVLEGGAIEVNGQGTVIATEQSVLNVNRNGHLSKEQMEDRLKTYLGASQVIWLKRGVHNDHTDGHVDAVARFVNQNTIVVASEEDPMDPNYATLQENWNILQQAVDIHGRPFHLIALPLPKFNYDNGESAPGSYVNFYIANELVLVPQFGDVNDEKALHILQECFPSRRIIGIDCRDLIYGGGEIHCITQQEPAAL